MIGCFRKKKGYPIIVGFPLFINHAKKLFFFPIYFFWKHPYRINIICSGWVSSVKFPLAGDPLQSLYDSRPYLPDLVFRGGGKLGWTQDELRVKILGSGSFTIPIFPNCTSLIWFAGTSEDRWIFRKNIGWRYHPIMVRKMWKDDGTQSLCNESDLCFCFFCFFLTYSNDGIDIMKVKKLSLFMALVI